MHINIDKLVNAAVFLKLNVFNSLKPPFYTSHKALDKTSY